MSIPNSADFDQWYQVITDSHRWDPFVCRWLDLPPRVQSTGYLSGAGLTEVLERLELSPGDTLVEVGCGRAGYGLAAIEGAGARLIGVDFASQALRAAEARAEQRGLGKRTRFQRGDLTHTGLPGGQADAVLCVDSIHFAREVSAAAAECARLLRPGCPLVITTWEAASPEAAELLPDRIGRMDIGRDLLGAGFEDIEVLHRPHWSETEVSFWRAAAALDPGTDPAMAALRDEATEFLPLATALKRLLVVARKPG
ncbi:MAG: methyltransferase domain-containing protein [Propionibacteriaceae bacterium]